MQKWTIQKCWNEVVNIEKYERKERDYISASDIGKPYLDRYYKMIGEPESNPISERVFRIFAAGIQYHSLVKGVFRKIGILMDFEQRVELPETEERVKIVGYYDLLVGGKVNKEKAKKDIEAELDWTPWQKSIALSISEYFVNTYPEGLEPTVIEVKSIHSNAMDLGYLKDGHIHYKFQLLTYLIGKKIEEGKLFYISRNDLTLAEYLVDLNQKPLVEAWEDDVNTMSRYYRNRQLPPREKDIIWDEERQRFIPNWRIERSPYFTKMTGFKDVKEWKVLLRPKLREQNKPFYKPRKKKGQP